jgi:hypothetical protein
MKALLLSFLLATASLLQAGDHIELGSLTTQSGLRVSCLYLIKEGQDTEVHLIFPGRPGYRGHCASWDIAQNNG